MPVRLFTALFALASLGADFAKVQPNVFEKDRSRTMSEDANRRMKEANPRRLRRPRPRPTGVRRPPRARLPHREGLRPAVPRRPPGLFLPLQLEPATLRRRREPHGLDGTRPPTRHRRPVPPVEHRPG